MEKRGPPSPGDVLPDPAERSAVDSDGEADPEALPAGTMVGEYRVEQRLGAGGFGAVYRAIHPIIGKPAAVKVLRRAYSESPDVARRFVDEARAVHRIGHRHIVDIFGFGALPDGRLYFVMELLVGESLETRLGRDKRLSPTTTIEILESLCSALHAAHAAGVVHRDLKPDNVFLVATGPTTWEPKLLDFGVAKLVGDDSQSRSAAGSIFGTPLYMSPEQVEGEPVDLRSDLYSLGVMVFRMLTGRHPFVGKTALATMVMHTREPRPRASEFYPVLSPKLDPVIARMLAIEAAGRPADALELLAELRRAVVSGDVDGVGTGDTLPFDLEASMASGPTKMVTPGSAIATDPTLAGPGGGASHAGRTELALGGALAATRDPTRDVSRRRWPKWLAVAGVSGSLALAGALGLRGQPSSVPAPTSAGAVVTAPDPLRDPEALIACPVWKAGGVTEPAGWLGAAAAHHACGMLDVMRGGRHGYLVPAALLDLPRLPSDGFPADPFGADDARERTLSAARSRAPAFLDGTVERKASGWSVSLALHAADSQVLGGASRDAPTLYVALRESVRELAQSSAVHRTATLDEAAIADFGTSSQEAALLLWDITFVKNPVPPCKQLLALLGADAAQSFARDRCVDAKVGWPELPARQVDRATNARFAHTTSMMGLFGVSADWSALQKETAKRRVTEEDRLLSARLASTEAYAWFNLEQPDRARAMAMEALKLDGDDGAIDVLASLARGTEVGDATAHFASAWSPTPGWENIPASSALRLELARRTFELDGGHEYALVYLSYLVGAARMSDARAIASSFVANASDPEAAVAGQVMLASVDAASRKLGAAVDRVVGLIKTDDWQMTELTGINATLRRADVIDRAVAGDWVSRFVLPAGSPKYDPATNGYIWATLLALCVRAGPTLGPPCMKRFDEIAARDSFHGTYTSEERPLADGVRAYVTGDLRGAARAWRKVEAIHPYYTLIVDVAAYDKAGDAGFASAIDRVLIGQKPIHIAGAALSHVREAKRAAKRGDKARAKELAQIVIDAWSRADVPIPAVEEMNAILDP